MQVNKTLLIAFYHVRDHPINKELEGLRFVGIFTTILDLTHDEYRDAYVFDPVLKFIKQKIIDLNKSSTEIIEEWEITVLDITKDAPLSISASKFRCSNSEQTIVPNDAINNVDARLEFWEKFYSK